MTRRSRLATFGSAAALVAAGAVCGLVVGGASVGGVVAVVLVGLGLVLATSLVFLEVGLSEDRARAREGKPTARRAAGPRLRGFPGRLERSRSHRRRLQ